MAFESLDVRSTLPLGFNPETDTAQEVLDPIVIESGVQTTLEEVAWVPTVRG